jgi:hypothetical protein
MRAHALLRPFSKEPRSATVQHCSPQHAQHGSHSSNTRSCRPSMQPPRHCPPHRRCLPRHCPPHRRCLPRCCAPHRRCAPLDAAPPSMLPSSMLRPPSMLPSSMLRPLSTLCPPNQLPANQARYPRPHLANVPPLLLLSFLTRPVSAHRNVLTGEALPERACFGRPCRMKHWRAPRLSAPPLTKPQQPCHDAEHDLSLPGASTNAVLSFPDGLRGMYQRPFSQISDTFSASKLETFGKVRARRGPQGSCARAARRSARPQGRVNARLRDASRSHCLGTWAPASRGARRTSQPRRRLSRRSHQNACQAAPLPRRLGDGTRVALIAYWPGASRRRPGW